MQPVIGESRAGGSSWQSLARAAGTFETDYVNGEIVVLGRLHGIATPANAALVRHARLLAGRAEGTPGPSTTMRSDTETMSV